MEDTTVKEILERTATRNPTEVNIICWPYTCTGAIRESEGMMRNYSTKGSYIETSRKFKSGTILTIRIARYPIKSCSLSTEEGLRSICLAEVKWLQKLENEIASLYGMGLRYLN